MQTKHLTVLKHSKSGKNEFITKQNYTITIFLWFSNICVREIIKCSKQIYLMKNNI